MLKVEYNLKDKVVLEAQGDVMTRSREQQGQEPKNAEPSRNAESNKEDDRRPKREINKPHYLKDFFSK